MMKNENNPIKKNLEEVFKNLVPKENAPEDLREEVFKTLDTLNLIGDIADLFTDKLTKAEVTFFDIIGKEDGEKEDDKEQKK